MHVKRVRNSVRVAVLALVLSLPVSALAKLPEVLPPPPEEPEWIEPVPLTHRLHVTTQSCDEGEPHSQGWTTAWSNQGELRLRGLVSHNGAEHISPQGVMVWQLGDRLVVSYEIDADAFPEAPVMACGAWTQVDIAFPTLEVRLKKISIYRRESTSSADATVGISPR
ncbi:hypothetical protein ABIE51_002773 [Lysobacter sp. OAE881]|uniref:hypothetical protein n=1 Tax=Lysobacter sp. OAE881 TaxID=2663813 RepID=UPI00178A40E7